MYEREEKIDSTIETFIIVKSDGSAVRQRVQVIGDPPERKKYCAAYADQLNRTEGVTLAIWRPDETSEVFPFTIKYNLAQIVDFDALNFEPEELE